LRNTISQSWRPMAVLTLVYAGTRGWNLLGLPIFNDEAIYLRWAGLIRDDWANLFIPAMDGKTPLFMWLSAAVLPMFPDPLVAGRFVSLLAGSLTVLGIFALGKILYRPQAGLGAALVYLLLPFSLIHDRLALADSLATCLATGLALGLVLYFHQERRGAFTVLFLGLMLGFGFLAKTPFLIFFIFPVFGFFLLSGTHNRKAAAKLGISALLAALVILPYFLHEPTQKVQGTDRVFHNLQVIEALWSIVTLKDRAFAGNLQQFGEDLTAYVTWPVLIFFVAGVVGGFWKKERKTVFLTLWFAVPTLIILLLARQTFSRYYLFAIPPAALLALRGWDWVWEQGAFLREWRFKKIAMGGVAGLCLLNLLRLDLGFIADPQTAPWAEKDRWQYTASSYSGYGIEEAVQFFKAESRKKPVTLFFSLTWGIPSDALYLYLKNVPGIRFVEAWWASSMPLFPDNVGATRTFRSKYQVDREEVVFWEEQKARTLFFIARDENFPRATLLTMNPNLKFIHSFNRFEDRYGFSVYGKDPSVQILLNPEQAGDSVLSIPREGGR